MSGLYLLIAVGLLTFTIQQNGYRAAGLAAFLPAFAVIEPVCGALLGLIIYHERLSARPGQIAAELVACAAATWGIARLAGSGLASGDQPGRARPGRRPRPSRRSCPPVRIPMRERGSHGVPGNGGGWCASRRGRRLPSPAGRREAPARRSPRGRLTSGRQGASPA